MIEAAGTIGLDVHRGGSMREGARVFLQAKLPDTYIGRSGVKRNITALNSHDGTSAIAFGTSSTVVICENTFNMAMKDSSMERVRHTQTAPQRVRVMLQGLQRALLGEERIIETFKFMANVDLKDEMAEGIISRILKRGMKVDETKTADLSTRRKNQLIQLDGAISRELRDEGATLWGLFNGVTRYTNHVAAPEGKSFEYVTMGSGARINEVAYEEVMRWIEQHTDFSQLVEAGEVA